MAHAAERTGPAILSAGGTVVAAMLVLTLADFKATQTMGPVLALGIAIMLLAGLTLLPAVLSILGRRAFWPAVPTLGSEQRRASGWRRIGHLVHERPLPVLLVCVVVLAVGSLGNLQQRGILDFGEGFQTSPDSKVGQDLIDTKLSAGQAAVTQGGRRSDRRRPGWRAPSLAPRTSRPSELARPPRTDGCGSST